MREGYTDELALFSTPLVDTAIEYKELVDISPNGVIQSDKSVDFFIEGKGSSYYTDLSNSRLKVKFKIVDKTGKPVTRANKVSVVNLFFHSLWNQVDFAIEDTPLCQGISSNYSFKSILDTLLDLNEECKETLTQCQMYSKDTGHFIDAFDPQTGGNSGLSRRWDFIKNGKSVELEGGLNLDIFKQKKLILNGVNMKLRLWPNKEAFRLMHKADETYSVQLLEVIFRQCRVKVSDALIRGHQTALLKSPALYNFTDSSIKTFTIGSGQYERSFDNLFNGQSPSWVAVALVSADAFSGNPQKNPFAFHHNNCCSIGVYCNGVSQPAAPLTPNFKEGCYVSSYLSLFTGTGKYAKNEGNFINIDEYPEGYCIFVFNLGLTHNRGHIPLVKSGVNTKLNIKFSQALKESIMVIVYGKIYKTLSISAERIARYE